MTIVFSKEALYASRYAVDDAYAYTQSGRAFDRLVRSALSGLQLTTESWLILNALEQQARPPMDLARVLGMQRGSLSRWLSQLCEQGLAESYSQTNDRRTKLARLTNVGREQLARARRHIAELLTSLNITMTQEDYRTLLRVLREVDAAVQEWESTR